jgi:hypothetical protein
VDALLRKMNEFPIIRDHIPDGKWLTISCRACVNSHEQAVRHEGGTQELIFDAIRLGSVIKGLCVGLQDGALLPQT